MRGRVLAYIRERGPYGSTDEEISIALGRPDRAVDASTLRARRIGLVREGLVVDSGRRRPTRSGALAAVWTVAEEP